jgi:23S rRNA (guanosine2251-2'-O)-methyltransferase
MNEKESYIYGRNAVLEALASGKPVEKIFISFGTQGESINKIFASAKRDKIPCSNLDKRKFAALEKEVCPKEAKSQGVIALMRSFETYDLLDLIMDSLEQAKNPVIVILDGITDPHNFGAIARSAVCSGAYGIVVPERNSAPISPVAVKASAGALEHIPVSRVTNLIQALETLKEQGFWIIGTDMQADRLYTDSNIYNRPVALIIGSEGEGMRHSTRKHCDMLISIPMSGKVSSLNASVSAGVILFEIKRQRDNG